MELFFLGTNGWYDTDMGNTVCILLKTIDYNIILDAGNGIHKLDKYINNKNETYLFISHFHLDHIIGLHILCKFKEIKKMNIYGPSHTKEMLNIICKNPFTVELKDLPFDTEIYNFTEEKWDLPFNIKALPLLHAAETIGFRIEIENHIIAYCPDTGYCENAVKLGKNSDLLIAECSCKSGYYNEEWPHLNPEIAAQIAKEAGAKQLALTHLNPQIYDTMEKREKAVEEGRKIFKNTILSKDNMVIKW